MSTKSRIIVGVWLGLAAATPLLQAQQTPQGSYSNSCSGCGFQAESTGTFQCTSCSGVTAGASNQTSFNMQNCASNTLMNSDGTLACQVSVSVTCIQGQQTAGVSPDPIVIPAPGLYVIVFTLTPSSTSGATFTITPPPSDKNGGFSQPSFLIATPTTQFLQDNALGNGTYTYRVNCNFPNGTLLSQDPTIVNQGTGTP